MHISPEADASTSLSQLTLFYDAFVLFRLALGTIDKIEKLPTSVVCLRGLPPLSRIPFANLVASPLFVACPSQFDFEAFGTGDGNSTISGLSFSNKWVNSLFTCHRAKVCSLLRSYCSKAFSFFLFFFFSAGGNRRLEEIRQKQEEERGGGGPSSCPLPPV